MRSPRRLAIGMVVAALLAVGLTVGTAATASNGDRLTAEEVRSIFVNREWGQGHGTFLFSADGTYRYADSRMTAQGTWQMDDSGVLCTANAQSGVRTCYTFYRDGNGYRYWHDREGRYWPAYPR